MKKLQNNFTTPEQSKRLLKLRVPAWTADLFYPTKKSNTPIMSWNIKYAIPCWSVGRLIEILKECILDKSELEEIFEYLKDCVFTVDTLLQIYKEWGDFIDFSKLEE